MGEGERKGKERIPVFAVFVIATLILAACAPAQELEEILLHKERRLVFRQSPEKTLECFTLMKIFRFAVILLWMLLAQMMNDSSAVTVLKNTDAGWFLHRDHL
jgi:hypothetical protein